MKNNLEKFIYDYFDKYDRKTMINAILLYESALKIACKNNQEEWQRCIDLAKKNFKDEVTNDTENNV